MKTTKVLFAAGLMLSAAVTVAQAADPVDTCSDTWTGFYLGSHVGYVTGKVNNPIDDKTMQGWLGGGLAGYNWQNCNFVWGLEADAGFGNVDTKKDVTINDFDMEPNGHLRTRLGYAMDDNWMPFIAGGLAIADGDLRVPTFPGAFGDTKLHFGFTVGGGVDYAWDDNWTFRTEYLYDDYGSKNYSGIGKVDFNSHTFRVAVTYGW